MIRATVKPELLRWARERAGMEVEALERRFPKYPEWERGALLPTLKQVEKLANATHAPVGYFFLAEPPEESLPIPDLRTVGSLPLGGPSPNLLSTIYLCQQRQEWYWEFARAEGETPLPFIGSETTASGVERVAARIRDLLNLDLATQAALPTWSEALRRFIETADALGVLVMVNGIVGNNTHRRLDPNEFRGFTLVDDLAPLVFINGADTKAAQMFTLAHELAHLWLGESALSDSGPNSVPSHRVEAWCNRVAAEVLVPLSILRQEFRANEDLPAALARLARRFKVSSLVLLRRIHDLDALGDTAFRSAYRGEQERLLAVARTSGGNFYPTLRTRVGRRFGHALMTSTLGGRTSFSESFRLLGIKSTAALQDFADSLGIVA